MQTKPLTTDEINNFNQIYNEFLAQKGRIELCDQLPIGTPRNLLLFIFQIYFILNKFEKGGNQINFNLLLSQDHQSS